MWQPEPGWQVLTDGRGISTAGVWLAGDQVVKRLTAPLPGDPKELCDPQHFAFWRRSAEVALSGLVSTTPGLRSQQVNKVKEDRDGITMWSTHLGKKPLGGLYVARCLSRFAATELPPMTWLARNQLADRMRRVENQGGWPTLARTTVADVTDFLWRQRGHFLRAFAELPQVTQHGDPTPSNLPSHDHDSIQAIDWGTLGIGAVGADVGYYSLSAGEDFDALVAEYTATLPTSLANIQQIKLGAQVNAVYTVISRAEWALSRVADGVGPLAGKFRHPSVAPYLRSLQRYFPQIEALIAGG
jgi:hypothetical protein